MTTSYIQSYLPLHLFVSCRPFNNKEQTESNRLHSITASQASLPVHGQVNGDGQPVTGRGF